jgi:hypothetical protein
MAKTPTEIRSLARGHTESAINCLAGIMNKDSAPEAARISAAVALLDRGWGKPSQTIIGGGEDDPAISIIHRIERAIVNSSDSDSEGLPTTS